jgi:hypothetical protein
VRENVQGMAFIGKLEIKANKIQDMRHLYSMLKIVVTEFAFPVQNGDPLSPLFSINYQFCRPEATQSLCSNHNTYN